MNRQKKTSIFLAGVSIAAIACSPAWADTLTGGNTGGSSLLTSSLISRDFLVLDDYDVQGDLEVDAGIGGGSTENTRGIHLFNGSNIEGDLIVDTYVTANQTEAGSASAIGIFSEDDSQIYGEIINNGDIGGTANANGGAGKGGKGESFALAFGSVTIGDDDPTVVNNADGWIYGDAYASSTDLAIAIAGGVGQVTLEEDANALIDNDGSITANATALAQNNDKEDGKGKASGSSAGALALGGGQLVIGETANAEVINGAEADITVLADASAISYDEAYAGAGGVGLAQIGLGEEASGTISNEGDISVTANASATSTTGNSKSKGKSKAPSGSATANAFGVGSIQVMLAEEEASADFTNDGDIFVDVNVSAQSLGTDSGKDKGKSKGKSKGGSEDASALGIGLGVGQVAGSIEEGASTTLVNNSSILVDVDVYATANDLAEADAFGIAALQVAGSVYGTANAELTNTSPESLDVSASAFASGNTANANAYVFAAGQVALSVFNTASVELTNEGAINARAGAFADGKSFAAADADAAGVNQLVVSIFDGSSATLTNSSAINVDAVAVADATDGNAYASAGAIGANQYGLGFGSVTLTATNTSDGSIDAYAVASAFSYDSEAGAYASASGLVQFALSGDDVYLTATNDGDISARAEATATGEEAYAEAFARGAYQSAFSGTGTITADQTNTLDAQIFAGAMATAIAELYATASAEAIGADQELIAENGEIYGTVTNDGTIRAHGKAYASQTGDDYRFHKAEAEAQATGVDQYGNALESGTVTLLLANTGNVYASATATANAYGSAEADADAKGVEQDSFAVGNASSTVDNSAVISAYAGAFASADYYADASATATGVEQSANSRFGDATASLTNTGTVSDIQGWAVAYATSYFSSASADATAQGVEQEANVYGSGLATTSVTNDGGITALAFARAESVYGEVDASADATGIDQEAESLYGEALASVVNSGDVLAYATALAYGSDNYDASADADATGIEQDVGADNNATATVDNVGSVIIGNAYAFASNVYEQADAEARAYGVNQDVYSKDGIASAWVGNGTDGYIEALAYAGAVSVYGSADADATATGIEQRVQGGIEDPAYATVENDGLVLASAAAYATAWDDYAEADADVIGIDQFVTNFTGSASASVTNGGDVWAGANANAYAYSSAYASAAATGVDQAAVAFNDPASAWTENSGSVHAGAVAFAYSSYDNAYAYAESIGVDQYAHALNNGSADAWLSNGSEGNIHAYATATAEGYYYALANATATGVEQDAISGFDDATATIMNDGTIVGFASAQAGGTGFFSGAIVATANAYAQGVDQEVRADDYATASLTNTSDLSIHGSAYASAVGAFYADANAYARGAAQAAFSEDEDALVETVNSGAITAFAGAVARSTSVGPASADAYATGLAQFVAGDNSSTAALDNTGLIAAAADASASSWWYGRAAAEAYGHTAGSYRDLTLDVNNGEDGEIIAFASATANYYAGAIAAGAWYYGFEGASLDGSIVNAGLISGVAFATAYSSATADAFGVVQVSDENITTSLFNSGIISAYAEGSQADATAIAIASYLRPQAVDILSEDGYMEEPVATITNSGGVIFAGEVETGYVDIAAIENGDGEPIARGNAINTRGFDTYKTSFGEAPNAVVINWQGGEAGSAGKDFVEYYDVVSPSVQAALAANDSYGYVFGNVLLTEDDEINVTDGVTIFDGVINGYTEEGDGPANIGELNIFNDGKLVMVQNTYEGPSAGYVDELNIASDGTLVYELTPNDSPGAYPFIDANTANIEGGTFVALYTAGIYGDSLFYDNIIDADDLYGEFGEVDDNSALLVTEAVYDGDDNVDLYVERLAFNEVAGMTKNQKAAGGAIEKVYDDIDPDSDFGKLVGNLFTLDDGDYQQFMDQLTGAEHAQHLRSVLWSTRAINRIITERMECDGENVYARSASATSGAKVGNNTVMPTADAPMATGCFEPGTASIWMRGFGQWNTLDGDENAPGYDETQYGFIFGGDYAFDENWFLGVAGGYFNSDGDFDDWGGRTGTDYDYDGLQLAAYGGYDNSTYYLRGVISYGNYDGESNRMIAFNGSPIDPKGDPSSDTWSFYGETGYRFGITDYANLTPFAGLSLATASLDSFTEDDPEGTGAALEVHDSDADSVASVLGVRFDADMVAGGGVFTPMVSVAWMHEFGDTPEVDVSFAGAPSGADFTVEASDVGRDSILIDAGAKYDLNGSVNFGLFYNGQFNEDYSSNAITARLGYKF